MNEPLLLNSMIVLTMVSPNRNVLSRLSGNTPTNSFGFNRSEFIFCAFCARFFEGEFEVGVIKKKFKQKKRRNLIQSEEMTLISFHEIHTELDKRITQSLNADRRLLSSSFSEQMLYLFNLATNKFANSFRMTTLVVLLSLVGVKVKSR